jgi:HSP20 family protein
MLVRWQPFQFRDPRSEINHLQNEINRLLHRFAGPTNGPRATQYPPLNVWEDENNLFVETELPGLELSDLEIYVNGGKQLTIKGERIAPMVENGTWHRRERSFDKFARSIELPYNVHDEKVEASFKNGVLTVQMPKRAEAEARRIEVKVN